MSIFSAWALFFDQDFKYLLLNPFTLCLLGQMNHHAANLKIETILFVPIILTFSKNLRCLNFPVWEQCCQQKNSKNDQKFFESAKMKKIHNFFSHQKCLVTLFCACVSAKFKHLKFFENVKIIGTNNIDSILKLQLTVLQQLYIGIENDMVFSLMDLGMT